MRFMSSFFRHGRSSNFAFILCLNRVIRLNFPSKMTLVRCLISQNEVHELILHTWSLFEFRLHFVPKPSNQADFPLKNDAWTKNFLTKRPQLNEDKNLSVSIIISSTPSMRDCHDCFFRVQRVPMIVVIEFSSTHDCHDRFFEYYEFLWLPRSSFRVHRVPVIVMIDCSSTKVWNARSSSNASIVCTDTHQDPSVLVLRVYMIDFRVS